MYTDEYIRELQNRTGNDPALLERVVYAFGLLEAIGRQGTVLCLLISLLSSAVHSLRKLLFWACRGRNNSPDLPRTAPRWSPFLGNTLEKTSQRMQNSIEKYFM